MDRQSLTPVQLIEAKRMRISGFYSMRDIAEKLGVDREIIKAELAKIGIG